VATGDAFDNFPPKPFRPLIAAARAGTLTPLLALLESRAARSLPTAYGWLTHRDLPHDLIDQWVAAYFADKNLRRDRRRLTAALGDDDFMNQIASELAAFTRPALLAWGRRRQVLPRRARPQASRHPPRCSGRTDPGKPHLDHAGPARANR